MKQIKFFLVKIIVRAARIKLIFLFLNLKEEKIVVANQAMKVFCAVFALQDTLKKKRFVLNVPVVG